MSKEFIHSPDIIGKNVKLLRISKDFTLSSSAEKAGISVSFLSLVEQGKRTIKFSDLSRLLAVYGTSITRFMSMIADTIDDYDYSPQALLQTKKHALLLDGIRDEKAYHIILHRPLRSANDTALLSLHLPADSASWEEFMQFDGEIRGIVNKGTLLLEFPLTEQVVKCMEEFIVPAQTLFRFRNHTNESTDLTLISQPGNP